MNIFKKALIVALSVGLISVPSVTREVEAASQPETLYLTPNANWKVDNARFAAYFFGNGETWVSMTDKNTDGIYEVTTPTSKVYPNVIFCRMNPSASANNWNNKWNQTADLKIPTNGNNWYTVKEGTWDNGGGTWALFAPEAEVFNVTFVTNCDQEVTSQEVAEGGTVNLPELEPTGYEFLGWFTDEECTNEFDPNTNVTQDLTLYAKWGEFNPVIAQYDNVIYFENTKNWTEVYCYSWGDSGFSVAWPGVKMNLLEGNIYWMNISEGQNSIIFNNNNGTQTVDITINDSNYFVCNNNSGTNGQFGTTNSKRVIDSNVYFQRQDSAIDNYFDVRFIGTFSGELADYENIGFVFNSNVEGTYKTTKKYTTRVYTSVFANGKEVNASEFDATYVYVITISGVPAGQKFDVTPYAVATNGTIVYGTSKTFAVEKN